MQIRIATLFLSVFILAACEGDWVPGETSRVSCSISDVPFGTAKRLSLSSDGESLYILDRFNHVYEYSRNDARTCAFELARTPENSDGQIPVEMAENIETVGSFLYYYDGISVLRYDDSEWSCDVSSGEMALTPSYIYTTPSIGIQKLKITSSGCSKTATSFGATRVQALDVNSDWIATVETSGALSDSPERFSIYDEDGILKTRSALASGDTSNSLHFCSATRVRFGAAFVALLDAKCGYLGVFDLNGGLEHRLDLSEYGIRNPVDMDIVDDDLYILTSSTVTPLYFLDFASFAFGEE